MFSLERTLIIPEESVMLRTIDTDKPHSLFNYFYVGRYKDTNTDVKAKTLLRFNLDGIRPSDIDNAYLVLIVDLKDGLTRSSSGQELNLEISQITEEWDLPSWNNQPRYTLAMAEEDIIDSNIDIEVTQLVKSLANEPNHGIMLKDRDESLPTISNNMKQFSTNSYIEINREGAPPSGQQDQPPAEPPAGGVGPGDGTIEPGDGGTEPPGGEPGGAEPDDGGTGVEPPVTSPGDATGRTDEITHLLQNCNKNGINEGCCVEGNNVYSSKSRQQCDQISGSTFIPGWTVSGTGIGCVNIPPCGALSAGETRKYCQCGDPSVGLVCNVENSYLSFCSQIKSTCIDADGNDASQKNSVTTYKYENGEEKSETFEDGCQAYSVKEAICRGDNVDYEIIACGGGKTCDDGVCADYPYNFPTGTPNPQRLSPYVPFFPPDMRVVDDERKDRICEDIPGTNEERCCVDPDGKDPNRYRGPTYIARFNKDTGEIIGDLEQAAADGCFGDPIPGFEPKPGIPGRYDQVMEYYCASPTSISYQFLDCPISSWRMGMVEGTFDARLRDRHCHVNSRSCVDPITIEFHSIVDISGWSALKTLGKCTESGSILECCYDQDEQGGGKSTAAAFKTFYTIYNPNGDIINRMPYIDECASDTSLRKYYCDGSSVRSEDVPCDDGATCSSDDPGCYYPG